VSEEFASGNWCVSPGREEEFVARWTEFLEWTRDSAPGLTAARLIHDADDPRHFISFATWESREALLRWRALPAFTEHLKACTALCDDFRGSNYSLAATV